MAATSRNRTRLRTTLGNKFANDFSKVGGLSDQIRLLREIIVIPLVNANLYNECGMKSPKGVIFYGPPGTGKTLVAGALANELSKEGYGKVKFYERKGADVLDKWVGESEKKLRNLFEQATKNRPSIIFFDELDGLAPKRSEKNDQIHCSIVATLLGLMDGLSSTPGVIIIGATNRLDAIDPALRRSGRFDRELYFPLPCTSARREILAVHLQMWTHKPDSGFITYLADITCGCNGADLQALCSEAFLCCLKRLHPNIQNSTLETKINIDKQEIKVEECDFLAAKLNIAPWAQRNFSRGKKLSPCIEPLLKQQLDRILVQLHSIWPHFTTPGYKLPLDVERCAGRLLLVGSSKQGLNMHLLPALLQALEHLPVSMLDACTISEGRIEMYPNTPSILLLSRVINLWESIDDASRNTLITVLEDIHPSSPVLLLCTSDGDVPESLCRYFINLSSIVFHIENPTMEERTSFFKPLFFKHNIQSILNVLHLTNTHIFESTHMTASKMEEQDSSVTSRKRYNNSKQNIRLVGSMKPSISLDSIHVVLSSNVLPVLRKASTFQIDGDYGINSEHMLPHVLKRKQSNLATIRNRNSNQGFIKINNLSNIFTSLVNSANLTNRKFERCTSPTRNMKHSSSTSYSELRIGAVEDLFKHVVRVTSGCTVSQLELLYDSISACIYMHKNDFDHLFKCLKEIVGSFENSYSDYI